MEVLEKDEEPSDVLGISGNFDITFKLIDHTDLPSETEISQ